MEQFMRSRLFILFLCTVTLFFYDQKIFAQETKVENVRFQDLGETVLIQYDLEGRTDKRYKVSIALSDDNGITFKIKPRSLSGDVGKNIQAGPGKKINWYYKENFPEGLSGSGFVFAVDAELQKGGSKLVWYTGGGVVVGVIVWYLFIREKHGSIVIDVPDTF